MIELHACIYLNNILSNFGHLYKKEIKKRKTEQNYRSHYGKCDDTNNIFRTKTFGDFKVPRKTYDISEFMIEHSVAFLLF